jgi:anti-sigma regulatory factor (Ser/Thr protein kinase)
VTHAATSGAARADGAFRHEIYPYRGRTAFLTGALPFVQDALSGGGRVLVAVGPDKERMLREALGAAAGGERVSFVDTAALGRNPGRLIPAWQDWITRGSGDGRPARAISEPPWESASPAERGELRYHEWLVNLAFARSPGWWLLCPYDTTVIGERALASVSGCHPYLFGDGTHGPNAGHRDAPFVFAELTEPLGPDDSFRYGHEGLAPVRDRVARCAARHGLDGLRLRELLVAATEVATNSTRHGGGTGTLRTWAENGSFICQFHDAGHITDPLAGRVRPATRQVGGRGMWLVQQLCDLVEIRSTAGSGTTVRLHMALPAPAG